MDLKEQIIKEYLEQGCGYRKLQAKYGISRTTIGNTCPIVRNPKKKLRSLLSDRIFKAEFLTAQHTLQYIYNKSGLFA